LELGEGSERTRKKGSPYNFGWGATREASFDDAGGALFEGVKKAQEGGDGEEASA